VDPLQLLLHVTIRYNWTFAVMIGYSVSLAVMICYIMPLAVMIRCRIALMTASSLC